MKRIRPLLAAALLGVLPTTSAMAADAAAIPPNTPEAAFAEFKKAWLAKDVEAIRKLVIEDPERLQMELEKIKNAPIEEREMINTVTLVETKTDGHLAVGIVKTERRGRTGYDDRYFVRRDGKWLLWTKNGQVDVVYIPHEAVMDLKAWSRERIASLRAGDRQNSPEAVFNAFRDAFLAKDKATIKALVKSNQESLERNLSRLDQDIAEKGDEIRSATIIETKVEGEHAIALVKMIEKDRPDYNDFLFVRIDGRWFACMDPEEYIPKEKLAMLREWYQDKKKALRGK